MYILVLPCCVTRRTDCFFRCSSYEAGYIEVYIRTISSNIQHPAAASPMLRTISPFPMNSAFIQIVDDVVGMMFWTEPQGGRIVIWSWKTGEMLVVSLWSYKTKLLTALLWFYRIVTSIHCPQIPATLLLFRVARTWSRAVWEGAPSKYSRLAKTRMLLSMLRTCYSLHCNCAPTSSCTAAFTPVLSWQIVLLVCPSGQSRKTGYMFFRCNIFR